MKTRNLRLYETTRTSRVHSKYSFLICYIPASWPPACCSSCACTQTFTALGSFNVFSKKDTKYKLACNGHISRWPVLAQTILRGTGQGDKRRDGQKTWKKGLVLIRRVPDKGGKPRMFARVCGNIVRCACGQSETKNYVTLTFKLNCQIYIYIY